MKKLVILCEDGHCEITETKDIDAEFYRIMKEGYGLRYPAVFHAEKKDGSHHRAMGENAVDFLHDPDVETVTVYPPLAGG